eukprot:5401090-Amphidinium_carterae.1
MIVLLNKACKPRAKEDDSRDALGMTLSARGASLPRLGRAPPEATPEVALWHPNDLDGAFKTRSPESWCNP